MEIRAQGFINFSDKTYGTSVNDYFTSAIIYNGSIYIAGHTYANIDGDKTDSLCTSISGLTHDIWIVKTDLQLNKIWDKSIGGNRGDSGPSLFINHNGHIVVTGISNSDSSCEKSSNCYYDQNVPSADYWIVWLDTNGNALTDKTFGGSSPDGHYLTTIEFSDGSYITCGISGSDVGYDKTVPNWGGSDYWCIKYDSAGNKIWDQVYGGYGNEGYFGTQTLSSSIIIAEENESFLIAGGTGTPLASGNISQNAYGTGNYGIYDAWVIKIDSSGNKIWDRRFGGDHIDWISKIIKTDDGYMAVGRTVSNAGGTVSQPPIGGGQIGNDVWVLKLDTAGNKIWDKRYGGTGSDGGYWIDTALGGGYIISGVTNSPLGYDISEPSYSTPPNWNDFWIFKIDTAGNKLWDKRFGGPGDERQSIFIQMPDSSIYLFGSADSGITAVKTDPGKGGFDYWIVHFKYTDGPTGMEETIYGNGQFTLSPNPVTDQLTVQYSPVTQPGKAIVFNTLGEAVTEVILPPNSSTQQISISSFPSGIYLLRMETEKYFGAKKFVKF